MSCVNGSSSRLSVSGIHVTGSEEDLLQMDPKKRRRMISNRESARRCRQRKRNHLDGLVARVAQMEQENKQITSDVKVTSQFYLNVEAENAVLRAQVAELSQRLHSLTEIVAIVGRGIGGSAVEAPAFYVAESALFMNYLCMNQSQTVQTAAVADDGCGPHW